MKDGTEAGPGEAVLAALRARVGGGWRFDCPAEAYEALVARGLAPPPDERRWWACPACASGRGDHRAPCRGGRLRASPDVDSLAAVASRGCAAWTRAEELARVVEPGGEVAWRAMSMWEIREHRKVRSFPFGDEAPPLVFVSAEQGLSRPPRWPEECPYAMRRGSYTEQEARDLASVRAAWPAVRALALDGVELVGHDREARLITLAAVAL